MFVDFVMFCHLRGSCFKSLASALQNCKEYNIFLVVDLIGTNPLLYISYVILIVYYVIFCTLISICYCLCSFFYILPLIANLLYIQFLFRTSLSVHKFVFHCYALIEPVLPYFKSIYSIILCSKVILYHVHENTCIFCHFHFYIYVFVFLLFNLLLEFYFLSVMCCLILNAMT